MQNKLLQDHAGQRTFLVVLQKGDEIMSCLQRFAETERITAAQITALGAFERAELSFEILTGFYDAVELLRGILLAKVSVAPTSAGQRTSSVDNLRQENKQQVEQ